MIRNLADNPVLLVVLLLVIVVVFGANRLPTAARSLGRSMRIFKSEVSALREDDEDDPDAAKTDAAKGQAKRAPDAVEGRVIDPPDGADR